MMLSGMLCINLWKNGMSKFEFNEQEDFDISQQVFHWWIDWVDTEELMDKHSRALDELEKVIKKIVVDILEKRG